METTICAVTIYLVIDIVHTKKSVGEKYLTQSHINYISRYFVVGKSRTNYKKKDDICTYIIGNIKIKLFVYIVL